MAFERGNAAALAVALLGGVAWAQSPSPGGMPPPTGMSLAQSAAMRFPQKVRVGDLFGRSVLEPVEAQTVLGRVRTLVRGSGGGVFVVMDFGGVLGIGARRIAVPIDAMVLVGGVMEVVAFTPAQLRGFATFDPAGTTPVPPDAVIKVGLAKPSH